MAVLGVERADFPVFFDVQTLRIYRVELVAELVTAIAKAISELSAKARVRPLSLQVRLLLALLAHDQKH